MAVKILLIACIGLLVNAQDDGRYRPSGDDGRYHASNEGKYSGNDGRYVHQENKYVQTKDQTGGTGSASVKFGADNIVVNIGGNQKTTQAPTPPPPPPPTTELSATPRSNFPPSPPFFLIDTGSNAVTNNPYDSSPAEPLIKILRQEQEESADGYHYVYETENGIVAEESGQIEKTESGYDALRQTGFYEGHPKSFGNRLYRPVQTLNQVL